MEQKLTKVEEERVLQKVRWMIAHPSTYTCDKLRRIREKEMQKLVDSEAKISNYGQMDIQADLFIENFVKDQQRSIIDAKVEIKAVDYVLAAKTCREK